MPGLPNKVDPNPSLLTASMIEASKEELHQSKMRLIARIAPVVAFSQVGFALWFSYEYSSFSHIAGLLWLLCLVAAISPELTRLFGSHSLIKRFRDVSHLRLTQAICLGVVWGIFPFLMTQISSETEAVSVFMAQLAVIALTAVYFFSVPAHGFSFALPAMIGAAAFSSNLWITMYSLPLVVFLLVVFLFVVGTGYLFIKQQAEAVFSEVAIEKRDNIIGLLVAEGNQNGHSEWLLELDRDGKVLDVPQGLLEASGQKRAELESRCFKEMFSDLSIEPALLDSLREKIRSNEPFSGFDTPLIISNKPAHWRVSALPIQNAEGDFTGHVILITDNTIEMNVQEEKSKLAHIDPLTGLMNRARFSEEIEKETAKLERYGTNFTLMFLDLDKFKLVNDLRGHMVGDKLLKQVGERIIEVVRDSDSVARLGGDEFAILMREDCDAGAAARLAGRLLQTVSEKYEIDGEHHSIGVSIGIALAPENGTRPNQLLRNADLALYRSKADGRGIFRFFESQMDAEQREKRMLELELREAIEQGQFELFYQPIISTLTGKVSAMEALIRWNHPIRGRILPDEFMPIAEQTSLIQEIGNWTIREACGAALSWPDEVRISINLSAQHLIGSDIVKITRATLEETRLDPHRLELEITESLFINNAEEAAQLLKSLKALGTDIVLDDFGTGYSSLSYILNFPFDKIKVDRSFVKASSDDHAARAILRMISGLCEQLGIRITAEGVETVEQVEFLRSIKCDEFQGYYFAKPLSTFDLPGFFLSMQVQDNTSEIAYEDEQIRKDA